MTNIASLLKSEISRVARKEIRAETQALKKAVTTYRAEIAALKRRAQALEREVRRLSKGSSKQAAQTPADAGKVRPARFSAKKLAAHRRRLGLSAAECGLLVGASSLSIYKWESGNAQPRAKFLPGIASFLALGKREAAARLASLR